jgi:hypothetical protein
MDSEMKDIPIKQREKFIATFGRETGDDDSVFFDEGGNALSEREVKTPPQRKDKSPAMLAGLTFSWCAMRDLNPQPCD